MSNVVNKIIAISRDTSVSASSDNGLTWLQSDLQDYVWQVSQGSAGKYLYASVDRYNPMAMVNYSITDGSTWTAGVLPTPQLNCIMAVARDMQNVTVSYDGALFQNVGARNFSNSSVYGKNKIFQTCSAVSTSYCEDYQRVNVVIKFVTCIAECISIIPTHWFREFWTTPPLWWTTNDDNTIIYNANERGPL